MRAILYHLRKPLALHKRRDNAISGQRHTVRKMRSQLVRSMPAWTDLMGGSDTMSQGLTKTVFLISSEVAVAQNTLTRSSATRTRKALSRTSPGDY